MKSVLALAALLCVVVLVSNVVAEEAAEVTITGVVSVVKNDEGAVTAVTVKAGDVTYNVVLDAKGKALAALAGKKAEVKGTVAEKALTVKSFKEVKEEKKE